MVAVGALGQFGLGVHQRLVHGGSNASPGSPNGSRPNWPSTPRACRRWPRTGPPRGPVLRARRWMSSSTGSSASRTAATARSRDVAVPLDPSPVVHVLRLEPLQVGEPLGGERRVVGARPSPRPRRAGSLRSSAPSAARVPAAGVRRRRRRRAGGAGLPRWCRRGPDRSPGRAAGGPGRRGRGGLAVRGRADSRFGHHLSSSTTSASTTSSSAPPVAGAVPAAVAGAGRPRAGAVGVLAARACWA